MNTYLIKKKEDFSHVFRNGSFLNCNSFTINYAKKSKLAGTNSPRFGIVASKKVGNAVQRNFAKRRAKALKNIFLNLDAAKSNASSQVAFLKYLYISFSSIDKSHDFVF